MKPTNIDNLHIELIIDLNGDILKVSSGQFIKNQFAIGDSIYTICPFLLGTIEGLPLREPYLVEGMFINANDREYGIDLDLFKATDNVTVLINDRTNVYNFVNHLNQQRNDLFFLKRELAQKNKELHRLRKAADIANEQKSRFLAMMSHEVRNPLNVILGYTELISKEEISLKVKDYLKNLAISGRNLKVIVDDILDLSRVEAGKLQLANDPMNLHHIIDQIENNYKTSHKDTDVVLVFEADKTIPNSIFGDDVRLIQIITNLINNSIKFNVPDTDQADELLNMQPLNAIDYMLSLNEEAVMPIPYLELHIGFLGRDTGALDSILQRLKIRIKDDRRCVRISEKGIKFHFPEVDINHIGIVSDRHPSITPVIRPKGLDKHLYHRQLFEFIHSGKQNKQFVITSIIAELLRRDLSENRKPLSRHEFIGRNIIEETDASYALVIHRLNAVKTILAESQLPFTLRSNRGENGQKSKKRTSFFLQLEEEE